MLGVAEDFADVCCRLLVEAPLPTVLALLRTLVAPLALSVLVLVAHRHVAIGADVVRRHAVLIAALHAGASGCCSYLMQAAFFFHRNGVEPFVLALLAHVLRAWMALEAERVVAAVLTRPCSRIGKISPRLLGLIE